MLPMTTLICRIEVNSSDINQWHRYSAGDYLGGRPLFLLPPFVDLARDTPDSIRCLYVMSESYPFFYTSTSSLCVSVKWRRRWDWRQEACCWYTSPLRPPPPPPPPPPPLLLITATTSTSSWELVYTQRWGFCRFDKVVSRTQSSTARPRKFGAPIRELQPRWNPTSGLFRDSYFSSSSSSSSLFLLLFFVSKLFFYFFSFLFRVSIFANAKMR